jgi:hypothetical protein
MAYALAIAIATIAILYRENVHLIALAEKALTLLTKHNKNHKE